MRKLWDDRSSPQIADWRRAGRVGERRLACGELSVAPSGKSTVGVPGQRPHRPPRRVCWLPISGADALAGGCCAWALVIDDTLQ